MDARSAPIAHWFPALLSEHSLWGMYLWQWLGLLLVVLATPVLSILFQRLTLAVGLRLARLTSTQWDDELVTSGQGPTRLMAGAAFLFGATRPLWLRESVDVVVEVLARTAVIVSVGWYLLRFLRQAAVHIGKRVTEDPVERARARAVQTQLAVLRAVFEVAIWVVGAALVLIQFDVVRNVGVSLLASAGIAGLAVGLAAQKSLSNILAGIQLSVTQPVRIGDVIIVEGDYGTVEDITLTYVVVRYWDLRHIVVPISYFLEKPFQNWSRGEPRMLGAVTLEVDFTADVEQVRKRLLELVEKEGKPLWDGGLAQLQVTDASDRTMKLRALVSAVGPEHLWDLRCLVRERLVSYLAQHPDWLPRTRAQAPLGMARSAVDAAAAMPPRER
ncbi:MAG TPA: mechanosensitive ion channel domain-containing protein [Myxococcales bacterium]|nr:mechanosensitive ion channel domain-containing protein [Myxococcales bacterium]